MNNSELLRATHEDFHEALPPLPPTRFARIPQASSQQYLGDRFSYMQAGSWDAPAIVFLHGIGANSCYFRFQLAELSKSYNVIAWNAPGYWLSDAFITQTPNEHDYANAVMDFLRALKLSQVTLCGNSFGSVVAQAFAIDFPKRVERLLLTGTGVGQHVVSPERRQTFEARAKRILKGGYQYADAGVDALVGPNTSQTIKDMLIELTRANQPAGLLRAVSFRLSTFYTPDHSEALEMPVWLVQGEKDTTNPRGQNADLLVPKLPHAKLFEWAGIGHLPEVEDPSAFNALVHAFMAQS
jgi:pimeloyl-ACP methyl ester carboxylesterase